MAEARDILRESIGHLLQGREEATAFSSLDRLEQEALGTLQREAALSGILKDSPRAADSLAKTLAQAARGHGSTILERHGASTRGIEHARVDMLAAQRSCFSRAQAAAALRIQDQLDDLASREQGLRSTMVREYRNAWRGAVARETPHWIDSASQLREREQRIRDWLGESPGLWDLEDGRWESIDWSGFQEADAWLQRFPALLDLAAILGRHRASSATGVQALEIVREGRIVPLGSSGLDGYGESRDLERVLSHEIALLADPATEMLFLERFADARLCTRLYHSHELHHADTGRRRAVAQDTESPDDGGPVIVCLDTSGSMNGAPASVGRALCAALLRHCARGRRATYLIAFSTEIRTLDLSRPEESMGELSSFLAGGFHGGTDLRPALDHAAELLEQKAWHNADVLIVSDFRVPKLLIKKQARVDAIRAADSRIHGLSIGVDAPVDDLMIFDSRWHFALGRHGEPLGIDRQQFRNNA